MTSFVSHLVDPKFKPGDAEVVGDLYEAVSAWAPTLRDIQAGLPTVRKVSGLSQEQMAEALGMKVHEYAMVERSNRLLVMMGIDELGPMLFKLAEFISDRTGTPEQFPNVAPTVSEPDTSDD